MDGINSVPNGITGRCSSPLKETDANYNDEGMPAAAKMEVEEVLYELVGDICTLAEPNIRSEVTAELNDQEVPSAELLVSSKNHQYISKAALINDSKECFKNILEHGRGLSDTPIVTTPAVSVTEVTQNCVFQLQESGSGLLSTDGEFGSQHDGSLTSKDMNAKAMQTEGCQSVSVLNGAPVLDHQERGLADAQTSVSQQLGLTDAQTSVSQPISASDAATFMSQEFGKVDAQISVSPEFWQVDVQTSVSQQFGRADAQTSVSQPISASDAATFMSQEFGKADAQTSVSQQFGRADAQTSVSQPILVSDAETFMSQEFGKVDASTSFSQGFQTSVSLGKSLVVDASTSMSQGLLVVAFQPSFSTEHTLDPQNAQALKAEKIVDGDFQQSLSVQYEKERVQMPWIEGENEKKQKQSLRSSTSLRVPKNSVLLLGKENSMDSNIDGKKNRYKMSKENKDQFSDDLDQNAPSTSINFASQKATFLRLGLSKCFRALKPLHQNVNIVEPVSKKFKGLESDSEVSDEEKYENEEDY